MYKVDEYRFLSESTELFTKNNVYYLRSSKNGVKKFLSTDEPEVELRISNGKLSLITGCYLRYLKDNFTYTGYKLYKNYREFVRSNPTNKEEFNINKNINFREVENETGEI